LGVALCAAFLASACESSSEREQGNQELRLTKMIDERRYSDVIYLIESDPTANSAFQGLLGMAYLGRAGFEPVRFGSQVLASQPAADPKLERLITGCDAGPITSPSQVNLKCVLKRIWSFLPDPDGADFAKSRGIFLAAYPNAKTTSPEYNTLIGTVEAASALARVEKLLLQYDGIDPAKVSDAQVLQLLAELQQTASEALETLKRARYSVRKVSELLTGMDKQPLFSGEDINIQWLESTGLPLLIQFASVVADGAQPDDVREPLIQILNQLAQLVKTQ